MDRDMKREQDKNQSQQSNLNRPETSQPTTGRGGTTDTEDIRRPGGTFEGSTGTTSGETESEQDRSDLERETERGRERNVGQ